jgi:RNA polymerase sigma-70 factor (ECF subfamily)
MMAKTPQNIEAPKVASRGNLAARRLTGEGADASLDAVKSQSSEVRDIFSARKDKADSHEDLVRRIADNKDRSAFAELFAHYAPRLKSYLMGLGLNDEKAEDLAQETMVTLWRKAAQFDPAKARLSTWLFRVARNRFIDHTRKQKYAEVDADDHMSQMVAPEQTDAPAVQRQYAERVKAALAGLKPAQKQVIELSFYQEMSHSEISAELALPLGTVKSRIRIAFEALRKELRDMA